MKMSWMIGMVLLAMPLAFAATSDDNAFAVAQDSNAKITAMLERTNSTQEALAALTQRVSDVEYATNAQSGKFSTELGITAVFTALLCAFLTYWFVARILVRVLKELSTNQTVQAPAIPSGPDPAVTVAAPAFDIVKETFCKKCENILPEGAKYCPTDGAKASTRTTKVPRLILEKANAQAIALQNRVRRTRFQKFVRWLAGA